MGKWIKFPIVTGNWVFDPARNFVVEISHGPEGANNYGGFDWMASNKTIPRQRGLGGYKDSLGTRNGAYVFMDLGFDITPTGVDGLTNVRSFGLFPNPSTDGRFVVSAESLQPIRLATVTVSNSIGQVVYRAQYDQPGSSLFKEVALPGVSKGVYFVEVVADGERIKRKLSLQ